MRSPPMQLRTLIALQRIADKKDDSKSSAVLAQQIDKLKDKNAASGWALQAL